MIFVNALFLHGGLQVLLGGQLHEAGCVLGLDDHGHPLLGLTDGQLGAVQALVLLGYFVQVDVQALGQLRPQGGRLPPVHRRCQPSWTASHLHPCLAGRRIAQRVSQIAFGLYGPFRSFSANPDSIGRLSGPHRGSAPLLQPGSASIGPAEQGPYFFPKDP